jgi:type IV secretion system protein VirB11
LEQLTAEVSHQPMREVIADAVDLIVSIERTARGRMVHELLHVHEFLADHYVTLPEVEPRHVA